MLYDLKKQQLKTLFDFNWRKCNYILSNLMICLNWVITVLKFLVLNTESLITSLLKFIKVIQLYCFKNL
jgi:hypothetical protein